ncbi:MAG: PQQ-binding-like beta-propeller repeat protein [Planctomycetaceae bacterium]
MPQMLRRPARTPWNRAAAALMIGVLTVTAWGCDDVPQLGFSHEVTPRQPASASPAQASVDAVSHGDEFDRPRPEVPAPDRDGEDWPQFLGPQETGISLETGLLDVWPAEGPPLNWSRQVGTGYSAPSVRGNRLVFHHRVADQEIIECVRADTGEPVWKHAYASGFQDPYGYNNGPRCSPLLTEERCYTFGAEGKLNCVDIETGELLWMRDTLADFSVPQGFFGVGATPILEGNKLIVLVGGQPNSGVVAFDAGTGATLWESVGKQTWDGAATGDRSNPEYAWTGKEMVVSYSSPIAATIHGKRHVLCLMRQGLVSVDPDTGAENFHYWFMSRADESVNAARPVVVGDTILLSAAYRVGSVLLKVAADGKSVDEVWADSRNLLTHWSTAIHHDGFYYGFSGRHEQEGALRCIRAADGKVVWETNGWSRGPDALARGPNGTLLDADTKEPIPWPYYGRGSAILADGRFIVLAERGTLALVEADATAWKEISRCSAPHMHYPCWAAPVLSRGLLYLRCEDALVCMDLRKPGE